MKIRNQESKKIKIKKIYIDDCPEYNGYRVLICLNDRYVEYIHKGVYINNIFDEIQLYLENTLNDEYIKI